MNPLDNATHEYSNDIPVILPHSNIYNIQVGSRLFKLSGASLSSDGPSYFTNYFMQPENTDKTLFLDRSPEVFERICVHLQGYYVSVDEDDDRISVFLAQDAAYFGLNRLSAILGKEYLFIRVGSTPFKVPKSLIAAPGNYPNYLTINNPLDQRILSLEVVQKRQLLRPPPAKSAEAPTRSARLFADILELLRGNLEVIRDDTHRRVLMRECRYYRFLELEQRIIKHAVTRNPYTPDSEEIIINVNDVSPKYISIPQVPEGMEAYVQYQRPYIAREPRRNLVFQVDYESDSLGGPQSQFHDVKLYLNKTLKLVTTKFSGAIGHKVKKLFQDVAHPESWICDVTQGPFNFSVSFITTLLDCHSVINGLEMKNTWVYDFLGGRIVYADDKSKDESSPASKKRRLTDAIQGDVFEFRLLKSQWSLTFLNEHPKLICSRFEGVSDTFSFNKQKSFI
ncbi:hypothetical protein CANTEDRAFT_112525 [Yamadazyma tenuis ATCC 10573]|uniref:Potassium channel tetramerisation-type BTB domain-containing protein n=1 Tax=Candida tenuis (strain ATCC 10573 / BCRC 21748 / CBS 615 / JCM 9827 / NBRC 10315 / NRRL Y-1498 / VKM Y-70) TaxID=590646 RepID=G3AXM6_CANTC|nr:uncharacterized protein CANTEDRAFT_112525 [Yamadazyma tenuis ATCC 10573]EGV66117.1 hypothetical protein CANTEDRAFT_112525 [Yamadazyma tenuis ATCC 10573]